MTTEEANRLEREADDRWTGPRLVILGIITLGIGLAIIFAMASRAVP